jgi:DNA-binding transcriptional LysR family regulator
MNITLKQLRAFVMVAREGSFTRAADNLHVTQSTLTSSIKILESELGMRLLDRSTRSVTLTAQGAQFLPTCDRLLRELTESISEMRLTATRSSWLRLRPSSTMSCRLHWPAWHAATPASMPACLKKPQRAW